MEKGQKVLVTSHTGSRRLGDLFHKADWWPIQTRENLLDAGNASPVVPEKFGRGLRPTVFVSEFMRGSDLFKNMPFFFFKLKISADFLLSIQ